MTEPPAEAVSFDLFGTLVRVERPDSHASAVAAELRERGVGVPDGWAEVYAERHVSTAPGEELPLSVHVSAALASRSASPAGASDSARGVEDVDDAVVDAVTDAFDAPVGTRPGAASAVERVAERRPVCVLSNCSVPGLAARALGRSAVDEERLDAVVASVACGWRKPDSRAFEAAADRLGVPVARLLHVGDDPRTDGGAENAGAESVLLGDVPLAELPGELEDRWD